jgi:plastocyanin
MHLLFRNLVLPALCAAGIALAGGVATPALAQELTVTISNFAFTPAETKAAAGDTVTFVNDDDTIHSIIADDGSFHSSGLDTNDKASFTFTNKGTFGYHCGLHPFMNGKIVVE